MENSIMSGHRPEKVRAWRATIDACKRSDQTVNAFCRARQITRSNLDRWRRSWEVRRSTLCDHLRKCGELLTPLYDLMRQRLLQSFAIHADDTPLVLLRPLWPAYAWVYVGDADNPYTQFDLTAGRRQEFPQAFLAGVNAGRANWLHVGGDDGLTTASVLLSVCGTATRHRLNPWSYLRDVLDRLAGRPSGADVSDLLSDAWGKPHGKRG